MSVNRKKIALMFSITGLLIACDREDKATQGIGPEPEKGNAAAYSKAWIQLKAKNLDPVSRRLENEKIAAEFGYTLPQVPPLQGVENPSMSVTASPKAGADIPQDPVPLEPYRDFTALRSRINSYYTHYVQVTVNIGETLSGTTTANLNNSYPWEPGVPQPPADPFMVAFYQSASSSDPKAYPVKVVGFNDDIDQENTDCSFSWTNNTSEAKTVTVLSFVYSAENCGFTTARVVVTAGKFGKLKYRKERWISGSPIWDPKIPNTNQLYQSGPVRSKIKLTKGSASGFGWGFGLLAINSSKKRGGFMYDTEGTLELPDVWKYGYPNLFLGIYEGQGTGPSDPTNYDFFFTELIDTYGLSVP